VFKQQIELTELMGAKAPQELMLASKQVFYFELPARYRVGATVYIRGSRNERPKGSGAYAIREPCRSSAQCRQEDSR